MFNDKLLNERCTTSMALELHIFLNYNVIQIPKITLNLCDLFDDEMFAPDVLESGVPKDKFPKHCPIFPNTEYALVDYKFSPEKLPPGIPDGPVIAKICVTYSDDGDEYFINTYGKTVLRTDLSSLIVFFI